MSGVRRYLPLMSPMTGTDAPERRASAARDVGRWRRYLQSEIDSAAIYAVMSRAEPDAIVAALYRRLGSAESRHARVWAKRLREAGAWRGLPHLSWRARMLITVARRLGPDIVGRSLASRELSERETYASQADAVAEALIEDEQLHGRVLGRITRAKLSGPGMARLGNALRAAVLGVNDGLVSNLSLVMGVIGAGGDTRAVVVAGFAGMLAGSLSMGLGEWLSVQSSRELYERQFTIERDNVAAAPAEEEEEIALIYQSQGMGEAEARTVARRLIAGSLGAEVERSAGDAELADLGGSAWVAAFTSFAMFASGAIIPLIPFAFLEGTPAALASALITGAVLFTGGCVITTITGKTPLRAGLRSVLIGYVAAFILYSVGRLLGVALD